MVTDGYLLREVYRDISGYLMADLRNAPSFPGAPTEINHVSEIESKNLGDNLGVRLSGFLIPPTDGDYVFYIAGDDNSELWLSTDESPAHKNLIASEPIWNGEREWTNGQNQATRGNPPANISDPIPLAANQRYYIEVLQKEFIFGDHVAVTWQKAGDPVPSNGSAPIPGSVLALRFPLALTALDPAAVGPEVAGTPLPDTTVTLNGSGFASGVVVLWKVDGTTTELTPASVADRQITVTVPAALVASSTDIKTAIVSVRNLDDEVSNALSFTIGSAAVALAESSVVPAGGTVVVTTAPVEDENGQPPAEGAGVSATLENTGGTEPITVTAATYSENPAGGTLFDTSGGFVDLQVTGNVPSTATMVANFYYPKTVANESSRVLLYFNTTDPDPTAWDWEPVISSGGVAPVQDTTDDLDGTSSGGRFTAVFDDTSKPLITALSGEFFATADLADAADTNPPVPNQATLQPITLECGELLTVYPTAYDQETEVDIRGVPSGPLTFHSPDSYTVYWTFTDGNNNSTGQIAQTVIVEDTVAPHFSACPPDKSVIATSALGAAVTYDPAIAIDNCGLPSIGYSKASGSVFPLGPTTVTAIAADAVGNTTDITRPKSNCNFTISVTYAWSGIRQPINADGTSVFKAGSTVPVKFQLTGASADINNAVARLTYTKINNNLQGTVNEADSTSQATTGNLFRYDATTGQYVFNWSTKSLTAGTYQLSIDLGDGVLRQVRIALR